jgi:hypothetical protein
MVTRHLKNSKLCAAHSCHFLFVTSNYCLRCKEKGGALGWGVYFERRLSAQVLGSRQDTFAQGPQTEGQENIVGGPKGQSGSLCVLGVLPAAKGTEVQWLVMVGRPGCSEKPTQSNALLHLGPATVRGMAGDPGTTILFPRFALP